MPDPNDFGIGQAGITNQPQQTQTQLPTPKKQPGWAEKLSGAIGAPFDYVGQHVTGPIAGGLGEMVGSFFPEHKEGIKETATQFGQGLPRMAAEAALTRTGAGPISRAVGLADVGLKSFAETSPDKPTGERLASAGLQTAAWHMAPKVGEGVANKVVKPLDPAAGEKWMQTAARRGINTIGALGTFEAANMASAAVQHESYNPLTPEHIGGMGAALLPMEALGLYADLKAQKAAHATLNTGQELRSKEGDQPPQGPNSALQGPQSGFDAKVGQGEGPGRPVKMEQVDKAEIIQAVTEVRKAITDPQIKQAYDRAFLADEKERNDSREYKTGVKSAATRYTRIVDGLLKSKGFNFTYGRLRSVLNKEGRYEDYKEQGEQGEGVSGPVRVEQKTPLAKSEGARNAIKTGNWTWFRDLSPEFKPSMRENMLLNDANKALTDPTALPELVRQLNFHAKRFPDIKLPSSLYELFNLEHTPGIGVKQNEVITHAAFRPDPTNPSSPVEYGANHPEILERLGRLKGFEDRESRNTPQFGFKTNLRDFITREEASKLMGWPEWYKAHSDEVPSAWGEGSVAEQGGKPLGPVAMDKQQQIHLRDAATELADLGYDTEQSVPILQRLKDNPELSSAAYKKDVKAKMAQAKVDLSKSTDPYELHKGVYSAVYTRFKDFLGVPDETAHTFAKFAVNMAGRIGANQRETRVFLAPPETTGDSIRSTSYYMEPTKQTGPFVGFSWGDKGSTFGNFYDAIHSLSHELFHGVMLRAKKGLLEGGDRYMEAVKNLLTQHDEMKLTSHEMVQGLEAIIKTTGNLPKGTLEQFIRTRREFYSETPDGRAEYMSDAFAFTTWDAMLGGKSMDTALTLMKYGERNVKTILNAMAGDIAQALKAVRDHVRDVLGWSKKSADQLDSMISNMKQLIKAKGYGDAAEHSFLQIMEARGATPYSPIPAINYDVVDRMAARMGWEAYDDVDMKGLVKGASKFVIPQFEQVTQAQTKEEKEAKLPIHFIPTDFLQPQAQLARKYSEWADAARLARSYMGIVKNCVVEAWNQYQDPDTRKLDIKGILQWAKNGTAVNTAFNKIGLKQNEVGKTEGNGRRLKPDEIAKIPEYARLTPEQKVMCDNFLDRTSAANMRMAHVLWKGQYEKEASTLSYVFMEHDKTLTWDKAKELGAALFSQFADIDRLGNDPSANPELHIEVAKGKQLLEEYRQLRPDVLKEAYEVLATDKDGNDLQGKASDVVQQYREYREMLMGKWLPADKDNPKPYFEGRPGYMSEARQGDFILTWKMKDGKEMAVGVKKRAEYVKRATEMKTKFEADQQLPAQLRKWEYFKAIDKTAEADKYAGMRPELFTTYSKAMNALINRVVSKIRADSPWAKDLLARLQDELKPSGEMAKLLSAPFMRERELIGGREELNMAENQMQYVNSVGYTVAKRALKGQFELYLHDPKMRAQPEMSMWARKLFNAVMEPSDGAFGPFKALMSFNYIFFSPSLAFVEGTQQLTNHIPEMIMQGCPMGKAFELVKQANVDFAKAKWRKYQGKSERAEYGDPNNPNDPNHEISRAVQEEIARGGIDAGSFQDAHDLSKDMPFLNERNMFAGEGNILDRQGLLGKPLYHLYQLGLKGHALAIHLNTEVAFVSAFRYFRGLGQDYETAFKNADDLQHVSMHGGGGASKPLWYMGIGKYSPGASVGGLMYFLQTYVYSTICQQARYLKAAIKNTAANPSEISAAHKAAASALGAQLVFAGLMGIPFSSQAVALIEQAFPGSEPKRRMREMFYGVGEWLNSKIHLAGQDRDMGNFLADAGTDGLMNSIPGGVNISNRFELGGLLGVSPYGGFDWKNVLGPGPEMLQKLFTRASEIPDKLQQGDYTGAAMGLFPNNNIQRVYKLISDGWNVRNKDERLQTELTNPERALQLLGFTPKRLAEDREKLEMKKRADKINTSEAKAFHERMAGLVINGKQAQVTEELLARAKSVELYDPREGARRIAELVQDRTVPFDPMSKGSRGGGTYKVGGLFEPPQAPPVSETQLLAQRLGIIQQLGFPGKPGKTEMRAAGAVDGLMRMYPGMTRAEAKSMVEYQLHPQRSAMWGGASPVPP